MSNKETTYEGLKNDSDFLSSAYHSLRGLGVNVSEEPEDIIDTFLQRRRYFDINLGSTILQGNDIQNLSDDDKTLYSYALNKIDKLPIAGTGGGAPVWDAIGDYAVAGITDPTNLLSILAGFFTAGGGTVAAFAGKEAVKRGIISRLQSAVSKGALKAYAVEGTISGAGGVGQQVKSQQVDMSLGRRKEGDYDYSSIALQGLAEGIGSPTVGALGNIIGGSVKDAVKPLLKTVGDKTAVNQTINLLKTNLLPTSSTDEIATRLTERSTGEVKPIEEAVEVLSAKIDDAFKKDFADIEGGENLLNKAMEGDAKSLTEVSRISPDMGEYLNDWRGYVKQAQDIAVDTKHLSPKIKAIYEYDPKKPYTRDIYEKFSIPFREDIGSFLNKAENKNIIADVSQLVRDLDSRNLPALRKQLRKKFKGEELKAELAKLKGETTISRLAKDPKIGLFTKDGKTNWKSDEEFNKKIQLLVGRLYESSTSSKAKLGPLKRREVIPDVVKQIWGYNNKPAVRALETVKGVIDSSARIRLASSMGDSLLKRGQAVAARDLLDAEGQTGEKMVKLVSHLDPKTRKAANADSPFILQRNDLASPELESLYVSANQASILKTLSEGFDGRVLKGLEGADETGLLKDFLDVAAATQGYLKKGKTVYSPKAHIRNFLGMVQYTIGTGNGMGLIDGIKYVGKKNSQRRKDLVDTVNRLGLKGSQVEINQILNRIGDMDKIKNPKLRNRAALNILTGGLPFLEKLFPKIARASQTAYVGTDDIGKIGSFLRERKRSENIWKGMSDSRKNELRDAFSDAYNIEKGTKDFDAKLLDEMSVEKVMNIVPIYSRIPKILEKMRGVPLLGSFTAFPAENLRNKYKIFQLAGRELREGFETGNTALWRAGANRLASQAGAASLPSLYAYFNNQLNGTEKYMDAMRDTLAPWQKYHAIAARKDKKSGKIKFTDFSYNNPDQFTLDFIMPFMLKAANGEDLTENLRETFTGMLSNQVRPFLDPSLAFQIGKAGYDYVTSDTDTDAANALTKWYKTQETGMGKIMRELATDSGALQKFDELVSRPLGIGQPLTEFERDMNKLYFGEDRYKFNSIEDLSDVFAKYGANANYGFAFPWTLASNEQVFDPVKNFGFASRTLLRNSNKDYDSTKRDIKTKLADPSLPIDYISIANEYNDVLSEEFGAYRSLADILSSYGQFMSRTEINRMLAKDKVKGTLSNNSIRYLTANKFNPSKKLSSREFLNEIAETNPRADLGALQGFFQEIEDRYIGRSLADEPPEPLEYED